MARETEGKEGVREDVLLEFPDMSIPIERSLPRKEKRRKMTMRAEEEQEVPVPAAVRESFTPEVVSLLLEEAQSSASEPKGMVVSAATRPSQMFQGRLHDIIQKFFEKQSSEALTIADLGECLCQVLDLCSDSTSCRPRSKTGGKDLFPLPVQTCAELLPGSAQFLQAVAHGLNDLNGIKASSTDRGNSTSVRALKKIAAVVSGSELLSEPIPKLDFGEFLKHRKVDYQGEEIKVARKMSWSSISPSLPDEVGRLSLRDFCEGGVLNYIDNFVENLLPTEDQTIGVTPRVMVDPDEWPLVAKGLIEKGICGTIRESELHHIKDRPLLNGMFAVSKQEWKGDIEICRLIMNLKPLNANSRSLIGDTGTLPSATSLGSFFLEESQTLLTCSEDIRCFFYLFRVPVTWLPFLAFGLELPRDLCPPGQGDERFFLTSLVLPMGYLNSVGVAQHIHRNVVRSCLGFLRPPLGGHQEIRRDRVFCQHEQVFRVYLDNFDLLTKCDPQMAAMLEGTPGPIVEGLRDAYLEQGLPRHPKKGVENQRKAEVQGAWVDGDKGTVCAKPSKVAKYVALALELLSRGSATQRELQIVGGGFVYVAMFRRPLLSSLNQIWRMIVDMEGSQGSLRWVLRREVICELARFVALLPLSFINLRLPFDPVVTASDASTTGGGICMSRGLTPYGLAASSASVRGDLPEEHDFSQILTIGLFDGISALRVATDLLRLPVAGHVSVEKNAEARRVVEAAFPDTIFVEDVESIDQAMCHDWARKFCAVVLVLIGAGPPCQGVSGLNSDRRGALKDSRSCLFKWVPQVVEWCKVAFPWAQVHSLGENVASMDFEDCHSMNQGYGTEPWFIDCHQISPCHRPRVYWLSWEPVESEGVQVLYGSDGRLPIQGEVRLSASYDLRQFLTPGRTRNSEAALPTFTTSRPSSTPLRRPAGLKQCQPHELQRWREDLHRFPPYQYRDENCLVDSTGVLRPPNVMEREVMLGFPVDFTKQCMSKASHGKTAHQDCRLSLLGNSWSVPVIAWLISCLCSLLGLMEPVSLQDIISRATPGANTALQSLLLRPPISVSTKTFDVSELLVKKLCGLVSLKGEDILLQSVSDIPVRYHRLRASLPANLWRWKDVAGWGWKGDPEHINVLELRSVLTTIKWRVEHRHQNNIRCVHLVDSLVVLHSLTRGRSSSRKMRRTMMRIASYLLCSGLQPTWAYVDTKQNPADRPSRRFVKKRWLKKRWRSLKARAKKNALRSVRH